jgi:8-oxo-dGTP pyrophosphatase MutT (NUDIX family)
VIALPVTVALSADWVRQRLPGNPLDTAAVPAAIHEPALMSKASQTPSPGSPILAAVLVPIVLRPNGLTVLLTQRTPHLRDHAGQISFPGGRCEPTDRDALATALREAQEEVGIAPRQVEILACLPNYFTSTGFCVTPVVGLVQPPLNLKLDDFEVAEVFEPPLSFLLDEANYRRHTVDCQGRQQSYWAVPWNDYFIWGATAGMLVCLRKSLLKAEGRRDFSG